MMVTMMVIITGDCDVGDDGDADDGDGYGY